MLFEGINRHLTTEVFSTHDLHKLYKTSDTGTTLTLSILNCGYLTKSGTPTFSLGWRGGGGEGGDELGT